jgi:hypothetical protein
MYEPQIESNCSVRGVCELCAFAPLRESKQSDEMVSQRRKGAKAQRHKVRKGFSESQSASKEMGLDWCVYTIKSCSKNKNLQICFAEKTQREEERERMFSSLLFSSFHLFVLFSHYSFHLFSMPVFSAVFASRR